jgi:hypothetical protein
MGRDVEALSVGKAPERGSKRLSPRAWVKAPEHGSKRLSPRAWVEAPERGSKS